MLTYLHGRGFVHEGEHRRQRIILGGSLIVQLLELRRIGDGAPVPVRLLGLKKFPSRVELGLVLRLLLAQLAA